MNEDVILNVHQLQQYFPVRNEWGLRTGSLKALDGVSLQLVSGEVLGVVGESGCGKSTLGKTIVGIHRPTGGSIEFDGQPILALDRKQEKALRTRLQYCYQDPGASLDPRWTIGRSLEEPLIIHTKLSKNERLERVHDVLDAVGLPKAHLDLYPHEISGGQQRRIGIARVLMLRPNVIILDEPTSGLDVSVQATVLNLLADLRKAYDLAYLMISHDLAVVRKVSDRIAVMYLGRIVETGKTDDVFSHPTHPYTQSLLASAPRIGKERVTDHFWLEGEPPKPTDIPVGCRFAPRCPKAQDICRKQDPVLRPISDHQEAACHFPA
jgi:oligopeptide/dipeptide ABC transporter ATP-binding protein